MNGIILLKFQKHLHHQHLFPLKIPSVNRFCNLYAFYEMCVQYGMDFPRPVIVKNASETDKLDSLPFSYPVIVKPSSSIRYWQNPFTGMKKVYKADSPAEAKEIAEKIFSSGYDDSLIKIKAAVPAGEGPDVFHIYEMATAYLANVDWVVPFSDMLEKDPLEAILSAADECGMAVFPGVGMYAWFDFSPESLIWPKRVATELIERYGHHHSFYGFYISEEIMGALYYGYPPVPDEKYKDIQNFFKEFSAFAHQLAPTKPVALAPNNIDMHLYQDEWKGIMQNLDILIPFAFARSENNIPQIAEMCKKWDVHFWVDMEIFQFPFDEGALVPKDFPALLKEIHDYDMLEQVYGYQYTGMLNEPGKNDKHLGGPATEELYEEFYKYQLERRGLSE